MHVEGNALGRSSSQKDTALIQPRNNSLAKGRRNITNTQTKTSLL